MTVTADVTEPTGTFRVTNRDNEDVAAGVWDQAMTTEIILPRPDKYFLYGHLAAGS